MNPNELKNRCVGAIAGFAIGDALGMPAAFLSRDQIQRSMVQASSMGSV